MRCLADGIRRRRDADDPFFDLGDASRQCYVEWWTGDARARFQDLHRQLASAPAVPCRKPLCGHVAPSVGALVAHIAAEHRHPCYVCGRVFPSDHLVHRHLQETHDPLFAILAARQRMVRVCSPRLGALTEHPPPPCSTNAWIRPAIASSTRGGGGACT